MRKIILVLQLTIENQAHQSTGQTQTVTLNKSAATLKNKKDSIFNEFVAKTVNIGKFDRKFQIVLLTNLFKKHDEKYDMRFTKLRTTEKDDKRNKQDTGRPEHADRQDVRGGTKT